MTFPLPEAVLASHTAILGKTGAGKTSTSKVIVEHLVGQGARVCILDPIKSDWWGLTSSADAQHAGLPFHILGGPRGHVPLHATSGNAIAEIVASSALPLSILDMAFFEPGGQSRFFTHFAPTLLRRMRGVLHLVIEEAHLFAPKERSGVGDENMAIHWAKMLATAGRSKGIRLIVATQRTQSLHNAVLGSCDTLIAHRLTSPADQKPVNDWLKANVAGEVAKAIAESLASLKTGTAWVCSGEARFFERVAFPPIATYDNTATPTGNIDDEVEIETAPVDVEALRAIVGEAAKEAEANDPKTLKAEIARLRAELLKRPSGYSQADIESAQDTGYAVGHEEGLAEGERREWRRHMEASHAEHTKALESLMEALARDKAEHGQEEPRKAIAPPPPKDTAPRVPDGVAPAPAALKRVQASGALSLTGAAARVHPARLTWTQVATLADRKARGGHFNTSRKAALEAGWLVESDGLVMATPEGIAAVGGEQRTGSLADIWNEALPEPAKKMFGVLRKGSQSIRTLSLILGMQPRGGHWNTGIATLRRNGLIEDRDGALHLTELT